MKLQPYRSHWRKADMHIAGWRGRARRTWKQQTHRLYRRLTNEALRAGVEELLPHKISVDDGT
ncbi:MAG: hypothetical protein Q8O40_08725 [Chloroflexota bacterium]|nr:hypothetical protein [Chloroflexota bacterium]